MWQRCTYESVFEQMFDGVNPMICARKRRQTLVNAAHTHLLRIGRAWSLEPERRAILALVLSRHFNVTTRENLASLGPLLYELHDDLDDEDLTTFVYYIIFQRLRLPSMVSFHMLNEGIFNECIYDALDIERRTRVNKQRDTQLFTACNCMYSHWQTSGASRNELFTRGVLSMWMQRAMPYADKKDTMRAFLRGVNPRCEREAPYFDSVVKGWRWRSQRKRKRATTTAKGTCGICFDDGIAVERTRCGHDFCATCLASWSKRTCPACRADLTPPVKLLQRTASQNRAPRL